jgi:NAD(P)H-quinone oxidoreductase subunit 5
MQQFLIEATWLIPCYGLVGALATLPWSIGLVKRSGSRPAAYINILATVISLIHGFLVFTKVWGQLEQEVLLHWFRAAGLDLTFALNISPTTVGAMELVTMLSLLAQCYALGYMKKDWSLARFFGLMGLFEVAMAVLRLYHYQNSWWMWRARSPPLGRLCSLKIAYCRIDCARLGFGH